MRKLLCILALLPMALVSCEEKDPAYFELEEQVEELSYQLEEARDSIISLQNDIESIQSQAGYVNTDSWEELLEFLDYVLEGDYSY